MLTIDRGNLSIERAIWNKDKQNEDTAAMTQYVMAHPPVCRPPNSVFIQLHTTQLRSRVLGHDNERACWKVLCDNSLWQSSRRNTYVRRGNEVDSDMKDFYPTDL